MLLSHLFMRWGMALMEQDSIGPAIEQLLMAIDTDPTNEMSYYYLGLCYGHRKEYEKGIVELEKALEIDPRFVRANLALIGYHLDLGDTAFAGPRLDEVESWEIQDPEELQFASGLRERMGDSERARELMNRALEIDPDFPPARLYMGEVHLKRREMDSAFEYLAPLEGLTEESDQFMGRLHYGLGRIYSHRGDPDAALDSFHRVVGFDSTSAPAHNQIGLIYDDMGEYEKALVHYMKALALAPEMYEVYSNIGVTEYKIGRYAESKKAFRRYLPHVEDTEEAERLKAFLAHIDELEASGGERGP
jgi:tetratricopeptide (TPR) repeat protein